jgi:hypothetical protein
MKADMRIHCCQWEPQLECTAVQTKVPDRHCLPKNKYKIFRNEKIKSKQDNYRSPVKDKPQNIFLDHVTPGYSLSLTLMTGFALLPTAPEEGPEQHDQNFKGVSRILEPKWAQLPAVTVGLLGVQMLWSVESSYGVC